MKADEILQANGETYKNKTADYGSSWQAIGHILKVLSHGQPIKLETTEDFILFGLFTRRFDKIAREFHGTFVADDVNFEAVADSAEDESVYAAMAAQIHQEGAEIPADTCAKYPDPDGELKPEVRDLLEDVQRSFE